MSHILLAEDDKSMREFLTLSLKKSGYEVTACEDGSEAYKTISQDGAKYDLLLTDIVMPGMDGIELSRKAQALFPNIKIMYITGFTASAAQNDDANIKLLSKPFHLGDLVTQVQELLAE